MNISLISHWNNGGSVNVMEGEISEQFYYHHGILGLSLALEGHTVIEWDISSATQTTPLLNIASDIIIVNLAPTTARIMGEIKDDIKIIALESDPPGGLDYCSPPDFEMMLKGYQRANAIIPLTTLTEKLFADKCLDLPVGINTHHVEKCSEGIEKAKKPTACINHVLRSYTGGLKTIDFLLDQGYDVIVTIKPDDESFGALFVENPKVRMCNEVSAEDHMKFIAESHLLCQLVELEACGSAISKAAALGIPSLSGPHYYQRLLFPDLICYSLREANEKIHTEKLLAESADNAKELAYQISLSNSAYRQKVCECVEAVYAE